MHLCVLCLYEARFALRRLSSVSQSVREMPVTVSGLYHAPAEVPPGSAHPHSVTLLLPHLVLIDWQDGLLHKLLITVVVGARALPAKMVSDPIFRRERGKRCAQDVILALELYEYSTTHYTLN